MNLKSPVFGDIGSYSYPFRLPVTARNKMLFKFPHREAGTSDPFIYLPGLFEWNGVPLFFGNARLKTVGDKSYEGTVFDANGDFYFKTKNLNLQQIDFGELVFGSETEALNYFKATIGDYYPTNNFALPQFHNANYFDPPASNNELEYYNYQYPFDIFRVRTTTENKRTILIPMLYLRYVLKKLFEGLGYSFTDLVFTSHSDYNRLAIFNQTSCNNKGISYMVPEGYSIEHIIFNYHVPRLLVGDFLKGLGNYFGFALFVDNITSTIRFVPLKDIVQSKDYIDFSKNVISFTKEYEEIPKGFLLKMATEDDFMNQYKDHDEALVNAIGGSVETYSKLPSFPFAELLSYWFVEDEGIYYRLMLDRTWHSYPNFGLYTQWYYGNGSDSIDINFSTIYNVSMYSSYGEVSGLITDYRGIIPRLLWVKNSGQPDVGPSPQNTIDGHSLLYTAESQIPQMWEGWKDFFRFKSNTTLVKISRQMSYIEIKNFDFSKKYMINGVNYLVRNIHITFKKDRILPALLECYKCD
jgi:hypothetical protein